MTTPPTQASPPAAPDNRRAQALGEQVRIQYRNMPTAYGGSVVMSTLLVIIMHNGINLKHAVAWVLLMYAQALVRHLDWRAYWRHSKAASGTQDAQRWGRRATLGAGASGLLWGIGSVLLFPEATLDFQLLLLFVLIGMGSASVYASAAYMPAFHAYLTPAVAPVGVMLLLQGGTLHGVLALMTFFYIPVTMRFAHNLNRSLRESIDLRFENLDLIERLREQTRAAENADAAKSRFLAAASHDLRQPMHALNLYVDQLRSDELGPAQRSTVDRIERATSALDKLFDALLDISRLDAGLVRRHVAAFPIAELLHAVRDEYLPLAQAKGLALRVRHTAAVVMSDRESVDRILRNLVQNAVRYTDRGGVLVGCRHRDGELLLQVWDTGPGIPEDQREAVFQEFYQAGNPERDRRKGLGLGLAIVDRLVRLLGHRLQLLSRVGRGSVFSVALPLGLPDQQPLAGAAGDAPVSDAGFSGELVAVVEDEPEILEAMRALLERWQCEVVIAESGPALRAALASTQRPPALLICDYRLRGHETGLEVVALIRDEFNLDIPALIITGDTTAGLRDVDHDPLTEVLHKPLPPAVLRAAMQRLMGERNLA